MYLKRLPIFFVVIWLLFASLARAQDDNPLDDPDLNALLKQAQEMQKSAQDLQKNPGSLDTRKKLSEMEAMAKEEAARQEQQEKQEKGEIAGRAEETTRSAGRGRLTRLDPGHPRIQNRGRASKKNRE